MNAFDRRLTPARPDIAAAHLQGQVAAGRFVAGKPMLVTAAAAPVRREPRPDAALDTEALAGEAVTVYDEEEGWAWGQLAADNYVGYLPLATLRADAAAPTHRVTRLRTFVYPGASVKLPPLDALSLNARVAVRQVAGDFAAIHAGGFIYARHLAGLDAIDSDATAIAERFIGVPYLWGGKTSLGLDCSALVQLSLAACGRPAPRDSDMQERELGSPIGSDAGLDGLRRGDLVFWKGHVGCMRDASTLLHANGHFMEVTSEPLAEAVARIEAKGGGGITSIRRL